MNDYTGKDCHMYALLRCLPKELIPPHPPQNWKDLKLDVETADTKIFSREGEKVWNKLPTNDRAIVRRASWQPAFARVNLN